LAPRVGERFEVRILEKDRVVWSGVVPFAESFGNVPEGRPLLFINSLLELAVALNQGDFARTHGIRSGPEWSLEVRRP
jgi:S-adenosylmethionine hydrolase